MRRRAPAARRGARRPPTSLFAAGLEKWARSGAAPSGVPLTAAALAGALLSGCGGWQSSLDPRSPGAAEITSLWWFMFVLASVLSTLVITGLLYGVYRARRASAEAEGRTMSAGERRFILLAGAAFPGAILVILTVLSVRTGAAVVEPEGEPALVVEVVGHQFWWEVRYPELGITTANEIRIPAGVPVEVHATSADVIHSFWVPKLSPGKIDMNPERTNRIWMFAEEAGLYRGQCTEFCGVQHALMSFLVIAEPEEEFRRWAAARQRPPPVPEDPLTLLGRTVFFRAACDQCHVIRGVNGPDQVGTAGPELTDLAARRTLGALTLENSRGHLGGWILDPHQFKPGVRMPRTELTGRELRALLAYLETLR